MQRRWYINECHSPWTRPWSFLQRPIRPRLVIFERQAKKIFERRMMTNSSRSLRRLFESFFAALVRRQTRYDAYERRRQKTGSTLKTDVFWDSINVYSFWTYRPRIVTAAYVHCIVIINAWDYYTGNPVWNCGLKLPSSNVFPISRLLVLYVCATTACVFFLNIPEKNTIRRFVWPFVVEWGERRKKVCSVWLLQLFVLRPDTTYICMYVLGFRILGRRWWDTMVER